VGWVESRASQRVQWYASRRFTVGHLGDKLPRGGRKICPWTISDRQWVHSGYGYVGRGQSASDRIACACKQRGAAVHWHRRVLLRVPWLLASLACHLVKVKVKVNEDGSCRRLACRRDCLARYKPARRRDVGQSAKNGNIVKGSEGQRASPPLLLLVTSAVDTDGPVYAWAFGYRCISMYAPVFGSIQRLTQPPVGRPASSLANKGSTNAAMRSTATLDALLRIQDVCSLPPWAQFGLALSTPHTRAWLQDEKSNLSLASSCVVLRPIRPCDASTRPARCESTLHNPAT
jgi:hypothetical protein